MALFKKSKKEEETGQASSSRIADAVRNIFNATVQGQQKAVQADQAVARAQQDKLATAARDIFNATVAGQQAATRGDMGLQQAQRQRSTAQPKAPTQRAQDASEGLYSAYLQRQESLADIQKRQNQSQAETMAGLYASAADSLRGANALYQKQLAGTDTGNRANEMMTQPVLQRANQRQSSLVSGDPKKGAGKYLKYMGAADFAVNSQAREDNKDATYNYINGLNGERERQQGYAMQRGADSGMEKYQLMTDEERGVYNYLYNTQGKTAANGFLARIEPELNEQYFSGQSKWQAEQANQDDASRFLWSTATVGQQPVRSLTSTAALAEDLYRTMTGQGIDPNSELRRASALTEATRRSIAEHYNEQYPNGILGFTGGDIYNTIMSAADSAMNAAFSYAGGQMLSALRGVNDIKKIEAFTNKLGSALMSSEVAATSVAESKEKGYTDLGAMSLGLVRGYIEYMSEKLGGEWAISWMRKSPLNPAKVILQTMIPEGVEELMSDFGNETVNMILDNLLGTKESYIKEAYDYFKENGSENPWRDTLKTIWAQEVKSFVGGALAAFGTGTSIYAQNRGIINETATRLHTDGEGIVKVMEDMNTDNPSAVYRLATLTKADSVEALQDRYQQVAEAFEAKSLDDLNDMLEQALEDGENLDQRMIAIKEQGVQETENAMRTNRGGLTYATEGGKIGKYAYNVVDQSKLSRQQKVIVDATNRVAQVLGVNVTVIDAQGDLGGAYLGNGNIYLNIGAGTNLKDYGKAIASASFTHELTHWMKDQAQAEYEELKQAVTKSMSAEQLEQLIREQMENQKDLTPDAAMEEVVANACQNLLQDSKAFAQLARENQTLAQKILDFLRDFTRRIRSAFAEVDFSDNLPIFHAVQAVEDHLDEMQAAFDKAMLAARGNVQTNENTANEGGVQMQAFKGYDQATGRGIYESNFPAGTPASAKQKRLVDLVQNVFSKKPIDLVVQNDDGTTEIIQARFDPDFDETGNRQTDLGKLAYGNRQGNRRERRVTLNLADDYYQILQEARYITGDTDTKQDKETHKDIEKWRYFVNDILYQEQGEEEKTPYSMYIDVKKTPEGEFVYTFHAEEDNNNGQTTPQIDWTAVNSSEEGTANGLPKNNIANQDNNVKLQSTDARVDPETEYELNSVGSTALDGVVVAEDLAQAMREQGFSKPVDAVDELTEQFQVWTTDDWKANYLAEDKKNKLPPGDPRVANLVTDFTEKMITNDAIMGYVPSGHYAKSKFGPLRKNIEYRWTFDMDASCPRTFQFVNYRNALQQIAGRPLTENEALNLMFLMRRLNQQIPCTYCYVENKRVMKSKSYLDWFKARSDVMNAETDEEALKSMYSYDAKKGAVGTAAQRVFDQWRADVKNGKAFAPTAEECWTGWQTARNTVFNWLDAQLESGGIRFGNGVRRQTSQKKMAEAVCKQFGITEENAKREIDGFVAKWRYDVLAEIGHTYDIANDTNNDTINQDYLTLNRLATNYASSSSQARLVDDYIPYTDQLKNVPEEDKKYIMGMGGIRKHSSNDFRMDYVQDYLLFYADLARGGWTGHTYTKSVDFCKFAGRTGDRINLSIAMNTQNGKIVENQQEGAAWKQARELRKAYDDLGVMAMVTDNAQLSFALNNDWIDMCIPFHASGLPKAVWYNVRAWFDYTNNQLESYYTGAEIQERLDAAGVDYRNLVDVDARTEEILRENPDMDRKDARSQANAERSQAIQDLFNETFGIKVIRNKNGNRVKPHFFPNDTEIEGPDGKKQIVPGHHNDSKLYMQLCEQYGVHPRFYNVKVTDADGNVINVQDHPNYVKLIKETSRIDTDIGKDGKPIGPQKPIQFNFDQKDDYLGMSPLQFAMQRMEEEAKNGGFANTAKDSNGIVDMFANLYLGKDRDIGWMPSESEYDSDRHVKRLYDAMDVTESAYLEMYDADVQTLDVDGYQKVLVEQTTPRALFQTWNSEQDAEYMSAVEDGNTRVQERMVQEAAMSAGAIEDPKRPGKPLKLYHGTPSFGFTEFNTPTIFTTDNPSISSGYGGNRGYAEPRRISDVYTPDDGSFDTLKKNAESIMGRSIRKATDEDRNQTIDRLRENAEQLQERLDGLWTDEATDTLYKVLGDEEFTSEPDEYGFTREADYDNVWTYMNLPIWDMTGYTSEEIFEPNTAEDIRNDLEKFFAYRESFLKAVSDHWDEIKGTPAEDLASFVRSYDVGDLAIYMQYSLMQSLREDAIVYEDTGKIGTEENLRESIERQKDLGSYELYGFAGDNQLVVECKGKMWYNLTVPGLVEESTTTDSIMKKAREAGYTSVLFKDLLDPAMNDYASNIPSNVYVFFDPSQVKSADRVTYDDNGDVIPLSKRFETENKDIRFQTWNAQSEDEQHNSWAPEFYSKLQRTVEDWTNGKGQPMGSKMSAGQVLGWLKGKGVKAEEIRWSGIEPWLEGKKSVTRDELLQVMAENQIQIQTETLGGEENEAYSFEADDELHYVYSMKDLDEAAREEAVNWGYDPDTLKKEEAGGAVRYRTDDGQLVLHAEKSPVLNGTKWDQYTLPGGKNYREILFSMPALEGYVNRAMKAHWNQPNVIAHARVQDLNTSDGRRVLFVEEAQSDLHNAGATAGFGEGTSERAELAQLREAYSTGDLSAEEEQRMDDLTRKYIPSQKEIEDLNADIFEMYPRSRLTDILNRYTEAYGENRYITNASLDNWLRGRTNSPANYPDGTYHKKENIAQNLEAIYTTEDKAWIDRYKDLYKRLGEANRQYQKELEAVNKEGAPDVPFAGSADTYHEYVMKHMLRLAAEGDYDYVGWTTAQQQSDRWSDEYAEGYRIEYDQNIPKFMNKYSRQWGSKVETIHLDNGQDSWGVPVTASMKQDVLEKGQPLFQTWNNEQSKPKAEQESDKVDSDIAEGLTDGKWKAVEGIDIMPDETEEDVSSVIGLTAEDNTRLGSFPASDLFGPTNDEREVKATEQAAKEGNAALKEFTERMPDDPMDMIAEQTPVTTKKAGEDKISTKKAAEEKTTRERISDAWHRFVRSMANDGDAIHQAGRRTGNKALDGMFFYAKAATLRAQQWIQGKRTSFNTQDTGEGLNAIFDPIRAKGDDYYRDFQLYMYHMLNVERMSRSNGTDIAVAKETLSQMAAANPELASMSDDELERRARQYREGGGLGFILNDEQGEMVARYWETKKELMRAERQQNKPVFGFEDDAPDADASKKIAQDLIAAHPEFEQEAQKVYDYTDALLQYRVDAGLITEADMANLKSIYPHYVPVMYDFGDAPAKIRKGGLTVSSTIKSAKGGNTTLLPLHYALAKQTLAVMRNAGYQQLGAEVLKEYENNEGLMGKWVLNTEESDAAWEPGMADNDDVQRPHENVITVFRNGKRYDMTLSEDMAYAFNSIPGSQQQWADWEVMRKGNDLFKKLCTAYNPLFMITNPVRDVQDALLYSTDMKRWIKNYPKAIAQISGNGKYWEMYKSMGAVNNSYFDWATGENANKKGGKPGKVEALNLAIEQAPRLAEYMTVLENAERDHKEITQQDLMEAFNAAAEITTNFSRGGTIGRWVNRNLVPFWNPGVQGLSKAMRTVTETKGFKNWALLGLKAAALGMVPALLNGLLYRDDDEWDVIDDQMKLDYYLFKGPDGVWIKIPKGRMLAALSAATIGVQESLRGDEVDWAGLGASAIGSVAPNNPLETNLLSTLFQAQLWNPDNPGKTWYGGDIESQRLRGYAPGERYDESTDVISKWLGGKLNISPKKISYVIDQYSGVLGDLILPYLTPKAERGLYVGNVAVPLSNAFMSRFTTDTVTSNTIGNEYYGLLDQLGYKAKAGDTAAAQAERYMNRAGGAVSDYYAQIRKIENDENLTDKEKSALVRELRKQLNVTEQQITADAQAYLEAAQRYIESHPEYDYTDDDAVNAFTEGYNSIQTAEKYYIDADAAAKKMKDEVYLAINREHFGAEYALQAYNKDTYAKAQKLHDESGLSYEDYFDYYFGTKYIYADKDSEGKSISGSKKEKIVEYIDGLDLPDDQKDALFKANNYKDLKTTPWHGGNGRYTSGSRRGGGRRGGGGRKKNNAPKSAKPTNVGKLSKGYSSGIDISELFPSAASTRRTATGTGLNSDLARIIGNGLDISELFKLPTTGTKAPKGRTRVDFEL